MFPLLDDSRADAVIRYMYRRYFDVAEEHGTGMLILGHDYRASPDWAEKLGYGAARLREMQRRTIRFLAEMREEYAGRVSDVYIAACIGPRGDAYGTGDAITEAEAEDYHSVQLNNLEGSGADMAVAATFNNIPGSIGVIRAAQAVGIPIGVSLTLNPEGRPRSGPSLHEAIETIDEASGGDERHLAEIAHRVNALHSTG